MSRVFRGCKILMTAAKTATPKAAPAVKKTTTKAAEAKPPMGIKKPNPLSPAMSSFLGVPEASRTEATKQIWAYIKLHNLQNPANKREVFCDEKLKTIFGGKDKVGFLEIAGLLSPHMKKVA